jgi:hypothetical protein
MRHVSVFLLSIPVTSGCLFDVRTGDPVPAESPARFPLRDRTPGLVESLLAADDWTGTVVNRTTEGRVSGTPGETWSEDVITLDVAASNPSGGVTAIPVDAYRSMLGGLRRRLRDAVEEAGGEQLDYAFAEGYRERSLEFRYKSGNVFGRVLARVSPKTDRPDEPHTRIQVTIHEQPASDR